MDIMPLQSISNFIFNFQDLVEQNASWNAIYETMMATLQESGTFHKRLTKFRSQCRNVSVRHEFSLLIFSASSVVGGGQNGNKSCDLDVS